MCFLFITTPEISVQDPDAPEDRFTELEIEPEPSPDPQAEPQPQPQPELRPVTEPRPEPEQQPEPEPEQEPEQEPGPGLRLEPEQPPKSEAEPGLRLELDQQPEPIAELEETSREPGIPKTIEAAGGRVTTIDPKLENVASIEVTGLADVGNLTVNPDNTLALVLTGTDHEGPLSFHYDVTFKDGSSQTYDLTVDVQPLAALKGWSTGESAYMLETDEDGDLIVEHGDNHRVVHVSNDDAALSKAELAALEGFDADEISSKDLRELLLEKTEYGATPDLALDQELGTELWRALSEQSEPASHWLLLERGQDYDDVDLFPSGMLGESQLHPMYVGAYGEGAAPRILDDDIRIKNGQDNVVVEDLRFDTHVTLLGNADNWIFNNVIMDGHQLGLQGGANELDGITVRNSVLYDSVEDAPISDTWGDSDRIQGIFAKGIDGFLVENIVVDHSGWEADYAYDGDGNFGQAPSKMSHNIYMTNDNSDITMRDSIIMRGASYGVQFRSGGFVEDNAFIDNNAAFYTSAGGQLDDEDLVRPGHFSLVTDNLVTSGGAKDAEIAAALTFGIGKWDHDTLLDNIVAHLADPNNPDEFNTKTGNGWAAGKPGSHYENTIVYNWMAQNFIGNDRLTERNADQNVDGVDTDLADQTTIQNFTADLLGQPTATIDDLGQYLRTQIEDDKLDPVTADEIIAYFQETFGIAPDDRFSAETLRFVPNDLGDGVRWDNRINWSTEDLPGTVEGDSVNLAGNWVTFATINATVQDLAFGSGGQLAVTSGHLTVEGETSVGANDGELDIRGSGQIWLDGYRDTDGLDIDAEGGRFANTGTMDGYFGIDVSGDAQAILATSGAEMRIGGDALLRINGDAAKVGFDGDDGGVATLHMEGGRLEFVADEDGFSSLEEIRSGAFGDDPDVLSGIDMGDGILGIDITALNGVALEQVLLGADEILGSFDTIELVGLGVDQDATIIFDYDSDEVTFLVTAAGDGTGQVNTEFLGDMMNAEDGAAALWDALTDGQGTYSDTEAPDVDEVDTPFSLFA